MACHLQIDADPDPDPASHFDADPGPQHWFVLNPFFLCFNRIMLLKSYCRCVIQGPEFLSLPQRVAPGPEAAEPAHQQERGAQAGRLWAGPRIRYSCQVRGLGPVQRWKSPGLRIRIRIRIGSGFNRVSGSGSGFGRAKMTHKSRKKFNNLLFLKC